MDLLISLYVKRGASLIVELTSDDAIDIQRCRGTCGVNADIAAHPPQVRAVSRPVADRTASNEGASQ
jgi:hypothetical protein